jgi:BirA family biotin operon repressor/biotin-[acetyl-CoA-carboxylase] ligase
VTGFVGLSADGSSPPEDWAQALEASRARLGGLAATVRYLATAGSTNDVALRLAAQGAAEGTVVLAGTQTAGRGRGGRSWFSPPGAGLYVSVILRPCGAPADPFPPSTVPGWVRLLTLAAGVAISTGVRVATGLPAQVKWPNDIVVTDADAPTAAARRPRKVAGILAEAQATAGHLEHIVLGYGINVRPAAYPPDVAALASSLETETGRSIDRGAVLAETLVALRAEYDGLQRGDAASMLERWRRVSPSACGSRVRWQTTGGAIEGMTGGIDEDGALIVVSGDESRRVSSGEVNWL